ncbi:MAG TPA: hypothetical protein DEA08_33290 [Planctomycetes bacterium]|nr:hypothetical protein [Planctomycetota bacterium]
MSDRSTAPTTLALLGVSGVLALAAPLAAKPKVERREVRVEVQPMTQGDRRRVQIDREVHAKWTKGRGSSDMRSTVNMSFELSVAQLDSASRVTAVRLRPLASGNTPPDQLPPPQTFTRAQILGKPSHPAVLGKLLCDSPDGSGLSKLRGTLRPDEEVQLDEHLWSRLLGGGKVQRKRATYLGVEARTGLIVVELRYEHVDKDMPDEGFRAIVSWKGHLWIDPKGPRVRRAEAVAEVEVLEPAGEEGEGSGQGRMSYSCQPLDR